ncbi:hypothetical protein [Thalassotalea mangrovi]|uniref:Red chlorophyll catabolite reductase n=1 Tax=Thalassotalea mangrovi TaxID=2572245 RepID=A0A4U1B813_9GAMM|nr:hypothetical protein [Thalassotalea mangrovi]TKB46073.1 hypothetical protein E8M12_05440 [Thalassotalea mangrovi]
MSESHPRRLSETTLHAIVEHFNMQEVTADNGGPYIDLQSQLPMVQGSVGSVRVFTGGPLARLVTCSIVVEQMQLDSHMLYGFMPADSAIPHFTLDSVAAGEHFAFHLDLTPRSDLGSDIAYMNEVFEPLTPLYDAAESVEGLQPAHISPRQRAIMSPWMLVHRASEGAFLKLFDHVEQYRDYWFELIQKGVRNAPGTEQLVTRDKANRSAIFSPEIDPVWGRVDGLIGKDVGEQLRALLRGE